MPEENSGIVTSVNGRDGDVLLTSADVQLGNVDNTSDEDKPISRATFTELEYKLDKRGDSMSQDLRMNSNKIKELDFPTHPTDATNKSYVDNAIQSIPKSVAWGSVTGSISNQVDLTQSLDGKVNKSDIGSPNGIASLDANGKIPSTQMGMPSGLFYAGDWDASTNTPTLANGSGKEGSLYKVNSPGVQNLGGGDLSYSYGDLLVCIGNGKRWERFISVDRVTSVNGKKGDVQLLATDVKADDVGSAKVVADALSSHASQTGISAHLPQGGSSGQVLTRGDQGNAVEWKNPDGAVWGVITGSLGNQADLNQSLNELATKTALSAHVANQSNPHKVTKEDVGLANVDNTRDADKPVSDAVWTELGDKVDIHGLAPASLLGSTSSGTDVAQLSYSVEVKGDTFAIRQAGGQISVGPPQVDTDAATKKYVDEAIKAALGNP